MPRNSNNLSADEIANAMMKKFAPYLAKTDEEESETPLVVTSAMNRGAAALDDVVDAVEAALSSPKGPLNQQRIDELLAICNELYDTVYVVESDVLFVRNKFAKYSHRPLNETEGVRLLTRIYKKRHPKTNLTNSVAHEAYRTLRNMSSKEVQTIDDRTILVGYNSDEEGITVNTLYWDADDGKFVKDISNKRCFRRLFDNGSQANASDRDSGSDKHNEWIYRLRLEDIDQELVTKVYSSVLAVLERTGGDLIPYGKMTDLDKEYVDQRPDAELIHKLDFTDPDSPINTFWVWSNYNVGRANDLLKAASSVFLKKKPTGAFLLVGKTRNGKSTFIDMLRGELGMRNTSGVKLTDFDDTAHFADDLATTMLNAPDDDEDGKEDKILKSQGTFKTITAHGIVAVRRLYSSNSIKLHARWMNIFPMNSIPQWQGSSKEACMKRSLCISFNNDLSRSDRASKEFANETFTAAFYSFLLGVQGAFAKYYADHDLRFSDEMESMRNAIKEDIDGEDVFVDKLTRMFKGMNLACVETEYQIWSRARHVRYDTKQMKARLKMSLGYESSKDKKQSTYYNYVTGTSCKFDKFGEAVQNDSDLVMADKQMILIRSQIGDTEKYEDMLVPVEELHRNTEVGPSKKAEQSVIQEIENYIANNDDIEGIDDYCKLLKKMCRKKIWT